MTTPPRRNKVLVLYNKLFHYRIPVFNELSKHYDLTVLYAEDSETSQEEIRFETIKSDSIRLLKFVVVKKRLSRLCEKFDVVIAYGDIAWLSYSLLSFKRNRKFKLIYWTIGVSASYTKRFDSVHIWDWARNSFYRRADAMLFYSSYPINKYVKNGFDEKCLFVANNTVFVSPKQSSNITTKKEYLLFIGTLYKEKGLMALLQAYNKCFHKNPNLLPLKIIGGGENMVEIISWIQTNELNNKITLLGPIYDASIKAIHYNTAIATISPLQAGLGVLESMGHGVPYITTRDAITGGERLNIINRINGVLLNSVDDLENIIDDIMVNKSLYLDLGAQARDYYNSNRKITNMVLGIIDAIEFVK